MRRLIVEENSGWDPDKRAEHCVCIEDALRGIAGMIDDGYHAGFDSPCGLELGAER